MRARRFGPIIRWSRRSTSVRPATVDFLEPAQIARQGARGAFDALPAEVLQQIVVCVHAVERGVRRMRFVKYDEQVVDEVWKRFGSDRGIRQWA